MKCPQFDEGISYISTSIEIRRLKSETIMTIISMTSCRISSTRGSDRTQKCRCGDAVFPMIRIIRLPQRQAGDCSFCIRKTKYCGMQ